MFVFEEFLTEVSSVKVPKHSKESGFDVHRIQLLVWCVTGSLQDESSPPQWKQWDSALLIPPQRLTPQSLLHNHLNPPV